MALACSCHSWAFTFTRPVICEPAIVAADFRSTLHISRNNIECRRVRRHLVALFPPSEPGHFQMILKAANSYSEKSRHRRSLSIKDLNAENIENDNKVVGSNPGGKPIGSFSMTDLISSYKEALLNGSAENVHVTESVICSIEREKNQLASKVRELTFEVNSSKEKFLRLNADFENFRKQYEKERARLTNDTQVEVIKSLLPMVDNFEKAKECIKPETEKETKIDASYRGIYKQFVETLRALGVSAVVTMGRQFDPLVHEAVARVGSQQIREGIIFEEIRRGFLLNNQVLRQATVKVSSGPGYKIPSSSIEEVGRNPEAAVKSTENQNSDSGS